MVSQLQARNNKLKNELIQTKAEVASLQQTVVSLTRQLMERPSTLDPPQALHLPASPRTPLSTFLSGVPGHSPSFSSSSTPLMSRASLSSSTPLMSRASLRSTSSHDTALQQLQAAIVAASMMNPPAL